MINSVSVARVESYEGDALINAVEAFFEASPSVKNINANTKILLKPNLVAKHPPQHAVTTHPAVLRAVILACKKHGASAKNIIVADSSGGIYNPIRMQNVYRTAGLLAVCKEQNVCAYDTCKYKEVPVKNGILVNKFEIIEPAIEADFIINLPKFKTHMMTGLTAATKNMFGVIPGLQKAQWHVEFADKMRFGHMIIDLYETITPTLNILDAVLGMQGDGPAGGDPRHAGLMLASENALNLDLAAAYLMQLDAKQVPYLNAAMQRGLCSESFAQADLIGDISAFVPFTDWQMARNYASGKGANVNFSANVSPAFRPFLEFAERTLSPYPAVIKQKCIGCAKCAEICPKQIITLKNKKATIHASQCIRCFCCHEMCPVKAIDLKRLGVWQKQ